MFRNPLCYQGLALWGRRLLRWQQGATLAGWSYIEREGNSPLTLEAPLSLSRETLSLSREAPFSVSRGYFVGSLSVFTDFVALWALQCQRIPTVCLD